MMQLKASQHAKNRIKERLNICQKKAIENLVKNAFHKGLKFRRDKLPKTTFVWVMKKIALHNYTCKNWRIYKGSLFLYSATHTLVTVYQLPDWLEIEN